MTLRAVAGGSGGGGGPGTDYVLKAGDTMTGALTVNAQIIGGVGTATLPQFTQSVDPGTGISMPGSSLIRFMTGSTTRMSMTSNSLAGPGMALGTTTGGAWGNFYSNGGVSHAISAKTAAYTATLNDYTLLCNGTFTVTVNPALFVGQVLNIKNTGAGTITIAPATGLIDGVATRTLTTQYLSVQIQSDGTNWYVL